MPCHTLETLRADPHLAAVGFFTKETHPTEGPTIALRPSIRFDGAVAHTGAPSQPLGWETRAVLRDLGMPEAEIDATIAEGAAREAVR